MNTLRIRALVTGVAFVVAVVVAVVLYFPAGPTTAQDAPCPENYDNLPSQAERDRCAEQKASRQDERTHAEEATARAQPTVGVPTPIPGTPIQPGYVPDRAQRVYEGSCDDVAEIPALRGCNSIWHIGALPSQEVEPHDFYVVARPPTANQRAILEVVVYGPFVSPEIYQQYARRWEAPQDVGIITITGVTPSITSTAGTHALISFTTSTQLQGTLNMQTGEWRFGP